MPMLEEIREIPDKAEKILYSTKNITLPLMSHILAWAHHTMLFWECTIWEFLYSQAELQNITIICLTKK